MRANVRCLWRGVLLLMIGSCSGLSQTGITTVNASSNRDIPTSVTSSKSSNQCVPLARWAKPGQEGGFATNQILPQFATQSVVLLGEFHDNPIHHLWQLQIISALSAQRENVAIGLEMLPRSAQPVLDQWLAGDLDEEQFLKLSDWYGYWRFDADLYLPILRFAKINQIPVYALNVERDLIVQVREKGWESIPEDSRYGITDPASPSEDYLAMLATTFQMHGTPHDKSKGEKDAPKFPEDDSFRRFVQGQQLWDRGMAQSIVDALTRQENTMLIGIMGSGHVMNRFGVPSQLADLKENNIAVLLPWDLDLDCELYTTDVADAVFGLAPIKSDDIKSKQRLGVHIENAPNGVKVVKVVDKSIAKTSGIEPNDIIIQLAGKDAKEMRDVVEAVQSMAPGTWLPIKLLRGELQVEIIAKFPNNQ